MYNNNNKQYVTILSALLEWEITNEYWYILNIIM